MLLSVIYVVVTLALPVVVVAGVVVAVRGARRSHATTPPPGARVAGSLRRLFTYIMAFAALQGILYGAVGLLALAVATSTLKSSTLLGAADLRSRLSFYLAALVVSAPVWLLAWREAGRGMAQRPGERDTPERRLFLAAVFATAAVVALFAGQSLLQVVLTLPGPATDRPSPLDGIAAGARLLVYGAAWLVFARRSSRERRAGEHDNSYDLALYVVAGFALVFLGSGVVQALRQITGTLLGATEAVLLGGSGASAVAIWGGIASSVLIGGAAWAAVWPHTLGRQTLAYWRVPYLYLTLLVAVPLALGGTIDGLYETLRRVLGAPGLADDWGFLRDTLPLAAVGAAAWAYHWAVLWHGVGLDHTAARAGIAWPRRPALALLCLAAVVTATPAAIGLLWLVADALLNRTSSLSGPTWWHDQFSLSSAALLVGGVIWLRTWSALQGAATLDPAGERHATARRALLGVILVVSALGAAGFAVALIWLILQALLGEPGNASTTSTALKDLSTVVTLVLLATYYGLILRRDTREGIKPPGAMRVLVLAALGSEALLEDLRQREGLRVEALGRLLPGRGVIQADWPTASAALEALRTQAVRDSHTAVLVLDDVGVSVFALGQ